MAGEDAADDAGGGARDMQLRGELGAGASHASHSQLLRLRVEHSRQDERGRAISLESSCLDLNLFFLRDKSVPISKISISLYIL